MKLELVAKKIKTSKTSQGGQNGTRELKLK